MRLFRVAAVFYALARLKSRFDSRVSRILWQAIVAILLAIGIGFLLSAAWIYLAQQFTALIASLVIGGAFVILACVVAIVVAVASKPTPQPILLSPASESLFAPGPDANLAAVLAAAVIGFVMTRAVRRPL